MTTDLLQQTLDELARRRGQWPAICRATGLDYDWLTKLAQGRIADPGVRKIQRLNDFFRQGDVCDQAVTHPGAECQTAGQGV